MQVSSWDQWQGNDASQSGAKEGEWTSGPATTGQGRQTKFKDKMSTKLQHGQEGEYEDQWQEGHDEYDDYWDSGVDRKYKASSMWEQEGSGKSKKWESEQFKSGAGEESQMTAWGDVQDEGHTYAHETVQTQDEWYTNEHAQIQSEHNEYEQVQVQDSSSHEVSGGGDQSNQDHNWEGDENGYLGQEDGNDWEDDQWDEGGWDEWE